MARKSKEETRIEREVDAACKRHSNGRVFNIFTLSEITQAGMKAGQSGEDIDAAVLAACQKHDVTGKVKG